MHKTFVIFLCFISFFSFGFAQNADSLKIANAFTKALTSPGEKEAHLKEALEISQRSKSETTKDNYAYLHARYLFFSGQMDEAEKKAIKQLKKHGDVSQKSAKYFNILGTINSMKHDYKKAISWYEKSIAIFDKSEDAKGAALVQCNIANIFFGLSDFESAYKHVRVAYNSIKPFNDSINFPNIAGVLSISEAKTGRYKSASKHAKETLAFSEGANNKNGIALAYLALAEIALSEKKHAEAIVQYQRTDSVSTLVNNRNFAHLAHVGLLSNYISLKDFQRAKAIGEIALEELNSIPNTTTEYTIRKNLSEAYAGLNDFQKAYIFRHQADSIYAETSSLKNKEFINELLIRHDTERKESDLKIERKENLIKQTKLTQQGWILVALSLALLSATLVFIGYRNVQRNKMSRLKTEQENELMRALIDGEEKERERVANELHDGLASDLTGIKLLLSQSEEKLPDGILSALSRVHEQTRRISHNLSPLNLEQLGLVSAIKNFTQENSTAAVPIQFYSSKEHIEIEPIEHAILIYRITQELIQNALKHAECSKINVQLVIQEKELIINVEDNGRGFDLAAQSTSFGLMNINKQVGLLKGEVSIDTRPQKGTVVFISLPLT